MTRREVAQPAYAPPSDFAVRWAMSPDSVWRLVLRGEIKGAKLGGARRIDIQDALRYERDQGIEPITKKKRHRNRCPVDLL